MQPSAGAEQHDLMIGLGAPFHRTPDGGRWVEQQTLSGLAAWQVHFPRVLAYAIETDRPPPAGWQRVDEAELDRQGIRLLGLPDSYDHRLRRTRRTEIEAMLLKAAQASRHRVFSYGGWLGDPGELAAAVSRRHGLAHAVWLDRVDSQVVRAEGGTGLKDRLRARVKSAIIAFHENRAVRTAELSLLHGQLVFDHFKGRARQPAMSDDIHYSERHRIGAEALRQKLRTAAEGPLKILYCGRAAPMKGPGHWLDAMAALTASGADFQATWLGDGPEMAMMQRRLAADPALAARVTLAGYQSDADRVRAFYRDAHVFAFCHISDESPRNLIESLHSGTPLVGYGDAYSQRLVDEKGAGVLVRRGDSAAMAAVLADLARDRARLTDLIARAGESASRLTREAVFAERAAVVKRALGPKEGEVLQHG